MAKPIAMVIALAILPASLVSQVLPEFVANISGYRSLAESVRRLREQTGWLVSVEEPVWPARSAPRAPKATFFDANGRPEEPPDQDSIRITIPTLRGPSARPTAIARLVNAYNQQNPGLEMRVDEFGDMTVILPESLSDAKGGRVPARTILSAEVEIPVEKRSPSEHMEVLAQAIAAQMNVPITVDDAAFGFRFNWGYAGQYGAPAEWGTPPRTARLALLDFLKHSNTSTVWQVDCQIGVKSPGRCVIGLIPLTIEVKDRTGRLTKKTLSNERGGAVGEIPPPPPGP